MAGLKSRPTGRYSGQDYIAAADVWVVCWDEPPWLGFGNPNFSMR